MHKERERAADYRAGTIAALLANANSRKGAELVLPGEFFPSLAEMEEPEEMSPEETKAYLIAMMQGLGGKPVVRKEA